jgi:sarcosine oxidase subunit beta
MSHHDVAIIGGGLVGCATAYYLARAGKRVILLEHDELNRAASGRNAGSLHFQIEPRMIEALREEPDHLAALVPVSLQAIEDWKRLPGELGGELEVAMDGGLMVAESEDQWEVLQQKHRLEARAGLDVRLLSGGEIRSVAPYLSAAVRYAAYCPSEGHANPRLVTPAFARAAIGLGAEVRTHSHVTAIEPHGARFSIRITGDEAAGVITADSVLVAAGAWTRTILQPLDIHLALEPVGLTMSVTEPAPPLISHLVQHIGRRLSIKQVADGNILIGGAWPALLTGTPDALPLGQDPKLQELAIIGNAAVAVHVVPEIRPLTLIRSWSGIAAVTPDHLPILGPVKSMPGLYVAAGGSSFTLGPTYARLIAEEIARGHSSQLRPYLPERFAA